MLGLQFGEILKMSAKEGISMPTLREARDDVLYKTALQGMAFRQGMEPKEGANTYRVGVDFMTNQFLRPNFLFSLLIYECICKYRDFHEIRISKG